MLSSHAPESFSRFIIMQVNTEIKHKWFGYGRITFISETDPYVAILFHHSLQRGEDGKYKEKYHPLWVHKREVQILPQ